MCEQRSLVPIPFAAQCATIFFFVSFALILSFLPLRSEAGVMFYISNLLSTSKPSTPADHTITFQAANAIPPSGKVVITPQAGAFSIPVALDFTDIDVATSSSATGTFMERTVSSTASVSADGISVVSGTSGSITITLSSGQGIEAMKFVRIKIGAHAVSGEAGDVQMSNSTSTGTYSVTVETKDESGAAIDQGKTLVAIVAPVAFSGDTFDFDPPLISNGLPTGTLPGGTANIEISLNTDEDATCRYATSSGMSYASMPNFFEISSTTLHSKVIAGFTDNASYSFYVRCIDRVGNTNPTDYPISFSIAAALPPPPPPGEGGAGGGTGSGSGGGGGGGGGGTPFPAPLGNASVSLRGQAYGGSEVVVLKDGKEEKRTFADSEGFFETTVLNLTQGVYTFSIYATDLRGRRSSPHTTTITAVNGTQNTISGIFISPTVAALAPSVNPGANAVFEGQAAPRSIVTLEVYRKTNTPPSSGDITTRNVKASANGTWNLSIGTAGFVADLYEARARAFLAEAGTSTLSNPISFGIGREPAAGAETRSDLNGDNRVNLVDFSVFLFHFNSQGQAADVNGDGRVNLADFSVLLFNWTG